MQEVQRVQHDVMTATPKSDEPDLRNIFKNMKHFFYSKADSLSKEFAYHYVMSDGRKRELLAKFKDAFELQRLIPQSVPMLDEMRHIINDDGHVSAEGAYKDDKVMAAALAFEAWRAWLQPILKSKAHTRARAEGIERAGGEAPVDQLILNYLRKSNITLPATRRV